MNALVLQLCFNIPSIVSLLQGSLPQPIAFLNSSLTNYRTGVGPLDLKDLIPPPVETTILRLAGVGNS